LSWSGCGELRCRRQQLPLGEIDARAHADAGLQVAQVLEHGAAGRAFRPFHHQRRRQRGERLLARQRNGGPVLPGKDERLVRILGHEHMAEA
jgi:hypothetical protein